MKKYEIYYETEAEADTLTYYDEDEAETEYEDITSDPQTIAATLKEFYIYGGMCQGENVIREYRKEAHR